jgi:hypothetical protein
VISIEDEATFVRLSDKVETPRFLRGDPRKERPFRPIGDLNVKSHEKSLYVLSGLGRSEARRAVLRRLWRRLLSPQPALRVQAITD